jgi:hypothetical protein
VIAHVTGLEKQDPNKGSREESGLDLSAHGNEGGGGGGELSGTGGIRTSGKCFQRAGNERGSGGDEFGLSTGWVWMGRTQVGPRRKTINKLFN